MTPRPSRRLHVTYEVPLVRTDWLVPEETVPQSQPHDLALDLLKLLLLAFVARRGLDALVARDLAIRFTPEDWRVGIDPDLCLISPRPPDADDLESLLLWKEGHHPPLLSIEVVSKSNPRKDYVTAPDRHAASGCKELWVFDPRLAGPKAHGGPHRIQIWREDEDGVFARVYAGPGPAFSPFLNAWLHAVDEGRKLRIADDREATSFWMTPEEEECAAKEDALAAKEDALAAKDAALARVAELEAELARRSK
jgi:Uma2 family endonuclease